MGGVIGELGAGDRGLVGVLSGVGRLCGFARFFCGVSTLVVSYCGACSLAVAFAASLTRLWSSCPEAEPSRDGSS